VGFTVTASIRHPVFRACKQSVLREIPVVNEILYMDGGRVTIPKECRERHGLGDGARVEFYETKSGALVLKPMVESPSLSLAEHLSRFQDVEMPSRPVHCPPRT
jgi:AbrB family looped-hinge helix DNA binding protein